MVPAAKSPELFFAALVTPPCRSWIKNESTLMLLVASLATIKWCKKNWKMIETLAYGYLSESNRAELSNEYQHNRV